MSDTVHQRGSVDDVVDACKGGIDRTLIRQNLGRTADEPFEQLMALQKFAEELREAGRRARRQ